MMHGQTQIKSHFLYNCYFCSLLLHHRWRWTGKILLRRVASRRVASRTNSYKSDTSRKFR